MAETVYTLNITVRNKIATTTDPTTVVNGNNDYTVVFDFDSEWDSLSSKTAMFVYGREEQKYKTVTFTGNSCVMPALYNTGYVLIGVFAGDIKTTTAAYVKCIPCIRDNDSTPDTGSGGTIDTGTNDHSQLINRDIADQHPISAITGLEEALTPLVGTTQTVTPSQVFAAIKAGRDVALQYTDSHYGTIVFGSFIADEKTGAVVSGLIIPQLDGVTGALLGLVDGEEWSFRATNVATKDDVGTAVNEALATAKASGEFDGADGLTPTIGDNGNWYLGDTDTGKPSRGDKGDKGDKGDTGETGATGAAGAAGKSAYSYAQDGGYTGTETEFAAKLAQEKFASPNALTFTGAVAGSYDGSEPLTVEIPSGGSGLSSNAKTLLIAILRNAIYNSDQSENITELEVELERTSEGGGAVTYTVESNLTNVTSDNTKVLVDANASYTATLTADDGYVLDVVTVIMGGEDVTASVYADGVITIPAVTGDVIITATAIDPNADILATTTWIDGDRVNSSGVWTGQPNRCASDYIAVETGDIITIMLKDGVAGNQNVEYGNFSADKKHLNSGGGSFLNNSSDTYPSSMTFTVGDSTAYIRISYFGTSSNIIVTATRQRGSV